MPSVTLRAHFNGTQVVLDEPFTLEPNVKLLVTVLPTETDVERDDWLRLSAQGLEAAYGDDEPEYSLAHLKEANSSGSMKSRLILITNLNCKQKFSIIGY